MSSWDGKAINGADLQADLQAVAAEIKKRGLGEVVAEALVEIDGRLKALEDAGGNIGDVVADSVNTQVLKVKGVDASPSDHTHQVKINGSTKTVPKTGGTPVDLGTYVTPTGDGTNVTTTPTSESNYTKPSSATKLSVLFGKLFYFVSRLRTSVRDLSSASDTEFPSEKAVATAIDGKQDSLGISSSGDAGKFLNQKGSFVTPSYPSVPTAYSSTPAGISTTGSAGSSTSWSKGDHVHPISLAEGSDYGCVKVAGTNVKVKGLNFCQDGKLIVDINGSATSLESGSPAYYSTDAMYIPISNSIPSGYTRWQDVFADVLNRLANKGRVYAGLSGPIGSSGTFEKYIPATYVFAVGGDPYAVYFVEVLDDLHDSSGTQNHGLIRQFTLTETGWNSITGNTFWPSYADRAFYDAQGNSLNLAISDSKVTSIGGKALHASTASAASSADSATSATNASNDGSGNNIVNTYAKKQVFVSLGPFSESISTSNSINWNRITLGSVTSYVVGGWHIYTINFNVNGANYDSATHAGLEVVLTSNENSPTSSNILVDYVVNVPKTPTGGTTFSLSIPFSVTGSISFKPCLWMKFDTISSAVTVGGNHFYRSVST